MNPTRVPLPEPLSGLSQIPAVGLSAALMAVHKCHGKAPPYSLAGVSAPRAHALAPTICHTRTACTGAICLALCLLAMMLQGH